MALHDFINNSKQPKEDRADGPVLQRLKADSLYSLIKSRFQRGKLKDMVKHGAEGYAGLTHPEDVKKCWEKFPDEIWKEIQETAAIMAAKVPERGVKTALDLITQYAEREGIDLSELISLQRTMLLVASESVAAKIIQESD
jgi:hypothetical protein